jgi:hypothetical protein
MDRKKRNTIAITALSVIALAGIGWFIYDKIKIKKLNSQLSTPEQMEQKIEDNLRDIPDGPIEETPVDPDLLPNMNFDGLMFLLEVVSDPKKSKKVLQDLADDVAEFKAEYAKNQAKWEAAREYCKDRMMEFKVITEKDLNK